MDIKKKIGIIGAEKKEIALLKRHFSGESVKVGGLIFFDGYIEKTPVCIVCSGIGKVNSAMCTQILISQFAVTEIINTGTAGGLSLEVDTFDIVVSTDTVQHDVDATHFGYALGQVPGTKTPFRKASTKLKSKVTTAFKAMQKKALVDEGVKLVEGRIASGDVFVSDKKLRSHIIKNFNPECTEMEGAAVAQVCALNKIPFIILRSISDNAGKTKSAKVSYDEFSKKAAHTAAMLVLETLTLLS
ncbi:MAG: 5'-nucleosidase [Treponema sp.]|nr:MAG: 5'-nucleosidase [Treponema sp.]